MSEEYSEFNCPFCGNSMTKSVKQIGCGYVVSVTHDKPVCDYAIKEYQRVKSTNKTE
jgi:hypothetical protein